MKEALVRAEIEHEAQTLRQRHEIERLQERLETAEARALDPNVISNVQFAPAVKVRPTTTYVHKALPSAPPRGLYQSMVPPTRFASPAPTI